MRFFETQTVERIGYDFYCDIAIRLVEARNRKDLTVEELAKKSGIKRSKLTRIELVQIRSYLDDLEKLAKCLDVTVNWLIGAEIDSQVGECLYLVGPENVPGFRLYQKATSKRLAYLKQCEYLRKVGVSAYGPRERAIVKLVGVPITDKEIQDRFPKRTTDEEEIYAD